MLAHISERYAYIGLQKLLYKAARNVVINFIFILLYITLVIVVIYYYCSIIVMKVGCIWNIMTVLSDIHTFTCSGLNLCFILIKYSIFLVLSFIHFINIILLCSNCSKKMLKLGFKKKHYI